MDDREHEIAHLIKVIVYLWSEFVDDIHDLVREPHSHGFYFVQVSLMTRSKGEDERPERPEDRNGKENLIKKKEIADFNTSIPASPNLRAA